MDVVDVPDVAMVDPVAALILVPVTDTVLMPGMVQGWCCHW